MPAPLDELRSSYRFDLPPGRIAQHPEAARDHARLLVVRERTIEHRRFSELPKLLDPGDLLVLNDVRVRPARLFARKATGGRVEMLVTDEDEGLALVRGSAKLKPGTRLRLVRRGGDDLGPEVEVGAKVGDARRVTTVEGRLADAMDAWGELPLPPYIERAEAPGPADAERYQTVYAREGRAVAAPTAGLHFTERLLRELAERGVRTAKVTLDVGPGTFRPVRAERLDQHPMHEERYTVPEATAAAVAATEGEGRRVIAVGTTSCRSLESWHRVGRPTDGLPRTTRLFLRPGAPPQLRLGLITNFHLPESTLIALVASFLGRERTLQVYRTAIDAGYRFYSYGDASLLL